MMRPLAIVVTAVLAAGCATAPSSRGACMALVPYDPDTMNRALEEMSAAPTLARMVDDYGDLRARLRAACGG